MKLGIAFLVGVICGATFMGASWGATFYFFDFDKVQELYSQNQNYIDAIHVAGQLGRLDFVSLLLAIIGVLLVFAALPVYRLILDRCRATVQSNWVELEKKVGESIEKKAIEECEERLPGIIRDYVELAKNSLENKDIADDLAMAQEDRPNE